jgi:hypothetical protein
MKLTNWLFVEETLLLISLLKTGFDDPSVMKSSLVLSCGSNIKSQRRRCVCKCKQENVIHRGPGFLDVVCFRVLRHLFDGRGGRGGGVAKSYDGEIAWSSINHRIHEVDKTLSPHSQKSAVSGARMPTKAVVGNCFDAFRLWLSSYFGKSVLILLGHSTALASTIK